MEWINIIGIVLPSIVTILVGWWQVRTMHTLARPVVGQQIVKGFFTSEKVKKVFSRLLIFVSYFLLPLRSLYIELTSPEPLNRLAALIITYSIAMILVSILGIFWFIGFSKTTSVFQAQLLFNEEIINEIDKLREEVKLLTKPKKRTH